MYLPTTGNNDPTSIMMLKSKVLRMMEKLDKLEQETTRYYQPPVPLQYSCGYQQQPPPVHLQYPLEYFQQQPPVHLQYPVEYYQQQPPTLSLQYSTGYQQQPPVHLQYPNGYQQPENPVNWRQFRKENYIKPHIYLDKEEIPVVNPKIYPGEIESSDSETDELEPEPTIAEFHSNILHYCKYDNRKNHYKLKPGIF